ncbi:MAG TPA: hypothetical protein PKK48_01955 [Phycisphaerae bacterium]|nr:hypothetical protein [Phycisphaerae bacterium]HPS52256.1 hypothetical protein [Phycisphaerae bacterium]
MTETTDTRKRKGKLIFLVAIVAVCAAVYMYQRKDLTIPGWRSNFDVALAEARKEGKMMVVLFTAQPPGEIARAIAVRVNMPANRDALFGKDGKSGRYIPACVSVSKSSPLVRKYDITQLPALMVLYPDGSVRNRHDGEIGEVPFRVEFLEYKESGSKK